MYNIPVVWLIKPTVRNWNRTRLSLKNKDKCKYWERRKYLIGEKQNDKRKEEQRWIGMNGTNLTHGKIWQHGRSTDGNAQDMSFHWDMTKKI